MTTGISGRGLNELNGKKLAIFASTGGHLTQAVRWHERLDAHENSIFVTFDSEQSRSAVGHRPHLFVPYVAPRASIDLFRATRLSMAGLKMHKFDAVLSTGASMAVAATAYAARNRLPMYFIESVSRFTGPSVTGKIVSSLPTVNCFTQHPAYASKRWRATESLLDDYCAIPMALGTRTPSKIFVTLGTIRPYTMPRLLNAVEAATARLDPDLFWQLGETPDPGLRGEVSGYLTASEFAYQARNADIVITHGGVGTILSLLEWGIRPVVMPRLAAFNEHVDDHQLQVCEALDALDLIHFAKHGITEADLAHAASWRIALKTPQKGPGQ